jgi:DNA polymerase III subunit gamma/tau
MTDLFGDSASPALALARKWRPRVFADLKGQEHVVQALSNALTQGRLHHAYLLTGTRGVGKTTLARILAKCLNCETGVTATPCGTCSACTQIDAGRFVDLLELDAASNTGVDNMREVLDNAQYAPTVGRYKVYIIDEVHMLSKPAFNSMLKTLEEPPAHVKFILATTDPQKIPVTVLSRCLQFNLKPMPPALVAQHLGEVLEQEQVVCEPAALNLLARAAAGSMRDALSLTDQAIAYGGGRVEAAAVEAMLGTVRRDYLFDLLDALAAQDGDALIAQARQLAERGIAFDATLQDLGNLLTQLALLLHAPNAIESGALEAGMDAGRMQAAAAQLDAETAQLYYQIALNGRRDLPYAPDEFSGFCMTLLRMLAFAPGAAADRPARATPVARAAPTVPPVAPALPRPLQALRRVRRRRRRRPSSRFPRRLCARTGRSDCAPGADAACPRTRPAGGLGLARRGRRTAPGRHGQNARRPLRAGIADRRFRDPAGGRGAQAFARPRLSGAAGGGAARQVRRRARRYVRDRRRRRADAAAGAHPHQGSAPARCRRRDRSGSIRA